MKAANVARVPNVPNLNTILAQVLPTAKLFLVVDLSNAFFLAFLCTLTASTDLPLPLRRKGPQRYTESPSICNAALRQILEPLNLSKDLLFCSMRTAFFVCTNRGAVHG